jgi:hypothetical protein
MYRQKILGRKLTMSSELQDPFCFLLHVSEIGIKFAFVHLTPAPNPLIKKSLMIDVILKLVHVMYSKDLEF